MTTTHKTLTSLLVMAALTPPTARAQNPGAEGKPRVCVAIVSNMSSISASTDRMAERLSKNLRDSRIDAVTMDSRTTSERKLRPTSDNREEAKEKECEYVLLTQVSSRNNNSLGTPTAGISIGRTGPGMDASDPLHGPPDRDQRENLLVGFALFRIDRFKPVLDTVMQTQPSGRGPDNLMPAMDRESSRVAAQLKNP